MNQAWAPLSHHGGDGDDVVNGDDVDVKQMARDDWKKMIKKTKKMTKLIKLLWK